MWARVFITLTDRPQTLQNFSKNVVADPVRGLLDRRRERIKNDPEYKLQYEKLKQQKKPKENAQFIKEKIGPEKRIFSRQKWAESSLPCHYPCPRLRC